jgi:endonuclease/exonuclease/phosphatase (EEP) superfamily protein YafD
VSDRLFRARNDQLRALAHLAAGLEPPKVLIGDFNLSPWSPFFPPLLKQAGLVNARDGFGILPTWPTFFVPAMIPLDHCLVSPEARVTNIETGPDIGSDHLPLIIDLLVRGQSPGVPVNV